MYILLSFAHFLAFPCRKTRVCTILTIIICVFITDSLDDCGLRFVLAMKHYNYLLRCLPFAQRGQFQKQGVGTNNLVWAFHSESEEELLGLIPSYAKSSPKWSILKELGVGWWLRNHTLLKVCVEKVGK